MTDPKGPIYMTITDEIRELRERHGIRKSAAVALVLERHGLDTGEAGELANSLVPPTADEFADLLERAGADVDTLGELESELSMRGCPIWGSPSR
jgi:hypothetical protein